MKVLVCGGSGYLGQFILYSLAKDVQEVKEVRKEGEHASQQCEGLQNHVHASPHMPRTRTPPRPTYHHL